MVNRTDMNESPWYEDHIPEDIKYLKNVQEYQEKIKGHYDNIKEHYDYQARAYKKLEESQKRIIKALLYNICFAIFNIVIISIYIYKFSSKM